MPPAVPLLRQPAADRSCHPWFRLPEKFASCPLLADPPPVNSPRPNSGNPVTGGLLGWTADRLRRPVHELPLHVFFLTFELLELFREIRLLERLLLAGTHHADDSLGRVLDKLPLLAGYRVQIVLAEITPPFQKRGSAS